MRQLWQQSLAAETGLEINIASFMYLRAHCFLPLHYLLHPFFPCFFLPPPLVTFLKNWRHRREIDVMKNNCDISMSHLLCRYGHPLSPQRGSRLSVAIGGILQISQQLSEVTSQVHRWPHSLPSSPLLEPASHSAVSSNFVSVMPGFLYFKILSETCMIHNNHFLWHIFNIPELIEFIERRRWKFGIPNVAS